ncbi:MAG: PstS family phosphate ABC transporter substrate-binding protein [Deltaproteobacteria bacterium]|nr:PstS family phosphate ABC transporter substrate-binding protein [Deltaproteobacteria bacterium]
MKRSLLFLFVLTLVASFTAACGSPAPAPTGDMPKAAVPAPAPAAEVIAIDGSSTVFPITEAVAEEFQKGGQAKVTVGISGTGGGFKKFCAGETVIANASRPIKPEEVELCTKNSIQYVELPVAYDGLAVVVSKENTWLQKLTVKQLKMMWEPEAQDVVKKWKQVDPTWPDDELHLFGPGVDSGTYDYFTQAIVGKEHASRGDFTASEDDNVLVQGVSTDKSALGFFGFAYYESNAEKLRLIPVDDENETNGAGAILPSLQTVSDGTYQPLSRPVFIYISKAAIDSRPEVQAFAEFYVKNAATLTKEVGYIPMPAKAYELVADRLAKKVLGSLFAGKGSQVGVTMDKLLAAEQGGEAPAAPAAGNAPAAAPK